jgi:Flp pilus assembly protein TadG
VLTVARKRDEQGAVAVMVAIVAVVLFVIAALVVDLGLARDTKRQSQNAADAAALAAGNKLYDATGAVQFATAVSEAKSYSLTNFGVDLTEWSSCTDVGALAYVPPTSTPCISFDSATAPTLVRVKVPLETLKPGLGTLSGVRSITVDSAARVALEPPGLPCIVCVLGSGQTHNLQNGDVFVDGGNVHFNGSVSVGTNGFVVTDGDITVEGTASPNPTTNFTPDAQQSQPAIVDPLAYLTLPPDMSTLTAKSNPCTQGPGLYGDFNFPNSLCTLTPGLYVISGPSGTEWDQSGNSSSIIAGSGVTLYFTCGTAGAPVACASPSQTGATLDAAGNGSIQISPPTSGPLQGVAIAYDRRNNATMRMTGNGISNMSGAVYMQSGMLQMNGNGCTATNSAIVVSSIEMNGNPACLNVEAAPSSNPIPPPSDLYLDQ